MGGQSLLLEEGELGFATRLSFKPCAGFWHHTQTLVSLLHPPLRVGGQGK
jgi:hypothetical protein